MALTNDSVHRNIRKLSNGPITKDGVAISCHDREEILHSRESETVAYIERRLHLISLDSLRGPLVLSVKLHNQSHLPHWAMKRQRYRQLNNFVRRGGRIQPERQVMASTVQPWNTEAAKYVNWTFANKIRTYSMVRTRGKSSSRNQTAKLSNVKAKATSARKKFRVLFAAAAKQTSSSTLRNSLRLVSKCRSDHFDLWPWHPQRRSPPSTRATFSPQSRQVRSGGRCRSTRQQRAFRADFRVWQTQRPSTMCLWGGNMSESSRVSTCEVYSQSRALQQYFYQHYSAARSTPDGETGCEFQKIQLTRNFFHWKMLTTTK